MIALKDGMVQPPPFISVVIPVWNSPDFIQSCLSALEAQDYPRDLFEVIVVDNGSTDHTAAAAAAFPIAQVLSEPEPSSYRARNRGLAVAKGELVAFTDADCLPSKQWLSEAARAARAHSEAGVLAGAITLFGASDERLTLAERYDMIFATFDQEKNAANGFSVTANWVSRRETLLALGGFNAELKSTGDSEFARRIAATGLPIVYVPGMLVRHPARRSLEDIFRKRKRVTGGRWLKNKDRWTLKVWLVQVGRETLSALRRVMTAPGLPFVDRLRLVGLVIRLGQATWVEVRRLDRGGDPERA